jgi:hypothetical protein
MATLPFGEYRPDINALDGTAVAAINNVIPRADGYGPFGSLEALLDELPDACRGYFYARNTDGTVTVFAGTVDELYRLDNTTLTWVLESKSGGPYTDLPENAHWKFAQFNLYVIAVQRNAPPQFWLLGTSTDFADLAGSPPAAGNVSVVNRFVVLSDLTSNPNRVQWSGLNAVTTWTSGTNSSDFQDLPDGGDALAVVGGEFGLILQQTVIRRMTFSPGSETIFDIQRVAEDVGLMAQHSVAVAGDRVFFLSAKGFQEIQGTAGLLPIGEEMVNRTFLADWDADEPRFMIAAASPKKNIVLFAYKSQNNSEMSFDKALVYNYLLKKWSPIAISGQYITNLAAPGLTLESLDAIAPGAQTITDADPANVLYVTFNGSDAATSATDGSPSAHALTFNGNAQLDTAQKKFGTASLLLDGTGDFVSLPDSNDWDFSALEPFTMHAWVYLTSPTTGEQCVFGRYNTTGNQRSWFFGIDQATTTPRLTFRWSADGATQQFVSGSSSGYGLNAWHHIAVTRDATGTIRVFYDGALVSTQNNATTQAANFNATANPAIGAPYHGASGSLFNGWIDELEVIKGHALWTAAFTPPSAEGMQAPVRITVGSTTGWTTGDYKTISSVGGTTGANGTWPIAVVDGTKADLVGSVFNAAYTSGGLVAGSLDDIEGSLDAILGSSLAELSAANTSGGIGFFSGPALEATLETAEQSGDGRRLLVRGFTPITDAAEVYGRLGVRENLNATKTYTDEVAMDTGRGYCPLLQSTRYAAGKIRIPAGTNWTFATGVRPDATPQGMI